MDRSFLMSFGRQAVLLTAAFAASACSTLLAVDEQARLADAQAVLGGSVSTDGHTPRGPLVVGVLTHGASGPRLVDYFVAEQPGSWVTALPPGTYQVAAFEDASRNGRYDDEPGLAMTETPAITLAAGEHRRDVDLKVPLGGRLRSTGFTMSELQARASHEQPSASLYALSTAGAVTTLDDPRFHPDVGVSGMWKPYDFLLHTRPGIYFLERYDPGRIPALFVHGVGGSPIEFRSLIDSLDRRRYQAWVAYYPSGGRLEVIGQWLAQLFTRLRTEHRFENAVVVAHSMGGLVARSFLLDDFERNQSKSVRAFVTISSPLGGMASAGKGVERSPVVIRAWYGLAPGSDFLEGLFWRKAGDVRTRRRLPEQISYHMIFGFRGGGRASSDGTVTVASQLRPEAQEEAASIRGFDEDHASVLRSGAVAARLAEILAQVD